MNRLASFQKFYYDVLKLDSVFTADDVLSHFAGQGNNVRLLLSGKMNKSTYIRLQRESDITMQWSKRAFYFFNAQDLEEAMFWVSGDRQRARKDRLHEELCAKKMRDYMKRHNLPGETCFSLFVSSAGVAMAFTGVYLVLPIFWPLKVLPYSIALRLSMLVDPYALSRRWELKDSISFLKAMRESGLMNI